eukprot:gene6184-7700_t
MDRSNNNNFNKPKSFGNNNINNNKNNNNNSNQINKGRLTYPFTIPTSTTTTTTTTTTTPSKGNFNSNNNNRTTTKRDDSRALSSLNKLGIKTLSSNDVETRVINRINKDILHTELKELQANLKKITDDVTAVEIFLDNNNEEDINDKNLNMSDDERNSLLVLVNLKKKKLSELNAEQKRISGLITKKQLEIREAYDKKIAEQKVQAKKPASTPQPSLLDRALFGGGLSNETERDRLIRTGKITPFANLPSSTPNAPRKTIFLEEEPVDPDTTNKSKSTTTTTTTTAGKGKSTGPNRFDKTKAKKQQKKLSVREKKRQLKMKQYSKPRHKVERKQEFYDDLSLQNEDGDIEDFESFGEDSDLENNNNNNIIRSKRKNSNSIVNNNNVGGENEEEEPIDIEIEDEENESSNEGNDDDPDYEEEEGEEENSNSEEELLGKKRKYTPQIDVHKETWKDDGVEENYQTRLREWKKKKLKESGRRSRQKRKMNELQHLQEEVPQPIESVVMDEEDEDQISKNLDDPTNLNLDTTTTPPQTNGGQDEDSDYDDDELGEDFELEGNLKIPYEIYHKLFEYQVTCVRWLWELHQQEAGGIVGDEMGLGKTIQIIAFLASLHNSKLLGGPALIVAPATLLSNWVKEFHKWWPPFRVGLYHSSGTNRDDILDTIASKGHILLTTFESVRINQEELLKHHWEYIILDEGHKIRNPDSEVTLSIKQFQTSHRIILSGSPIQNRLTELWSLFDFVFPGKLGTLPIFQAQFSVPIGLGGFSNATPVQVQTAYKCAVALRDLISPYMLRRVKSDVLQSLPSKNEQILMCPLTPFQEKLYLEFLDSNDARSVLEGRKNLLYAIDILKKICNHPDILHKDEDDDDRPVDYGNIERSSKLKVVEQILPIWKRQGDKVLLFCQTRQMLDIIEDFVCNHTKYQYRRMDGTTSVKNRQTLVEEFNLDPNLFIFLLTTKVGGLGLNLTGANRVILYDPDWNPSTDTQARERVYRIGQTKVVTIYRLVTSGTIEEKIYHRQIYKQFLTNKILKDPRQKRFFKTRHFKDLLTYSKVEKGSETGDIFSGSNSEILPEHLRKDDDGSEEPSKKKKKTTNEGEEEEEEDIQKDSSKQDDDSYILKCLFEKEGLSSALKHDIIMDQSAPELSILEKEAEKIATKAVKILKQSREQIEKNRAQFIPTWTGKFGSGGAPSIVKDKIDGVPSSGGGRFGNKSKLASTQQTNTSSSSMEISTNTLNNRSSNDDNNNNSNGSKYSSSKILTMLNEEEEQNASDMFGGIKPNEIIENIFNFIVSKGGSVTTQAIINNFSLDITEEQAPLFRSLLKSVAEFNKASKRWSIRPEFLLR